MVESYPMSDTHKKVLKYRPKQNHCLRRKELDNLRHLSGSIVFLWLNNEYGFWYHIHDVNGNTLIGYMLENDLWRYYPISIKTIWSYF